MHDSLFRNTIWRNPLPDPTEADFCMGVVLFLYWSCIPPAAPRMPLQPLPPGIGRYGF